MSEALSVVTDLLTIASITVALALDVRRSHKREDTDEGNTGE